MRNPSKSYKTHGYALQAPKSRPLSFLEILLLLYSCAISYLYHQSSPCDCTLLVGRSLVSDTESNSNDNDWVQKHVIGKENFPSSSVEFPHIFEDGFKPSKFCRSVNKSMCEHKTFKHAKNMNTLHGEQLMYSPFELGNQHISVDQVCRVFVWCFLSVEYHIALCL